MRRVARMFLFLGVMTLATARRHTSHLKETKGTVEKFGEITHDAEDWPYHSRSSNDAKYRRHRSRSSKETEDPCHYRYSSNAIENQRNHSSSLNETNNRGHRSRSSKETEDEFQHSHSSKEIKDRPSDNNNLLETKYPCRRRNSSKETKDWPYQSNSLIETKDQPYQSNSLIETKDWPYQSNSLIETKDQPYQSNSLIETKYQPYQSNSSIETKDQPYQSNSSIETKDRPYQSNSSIETKDQPYQSNSSIETKDQPYQSNNSEETEDPRRRRSISNETEDRPRHCKEVLDSGDNMTGVRSVYPYHDDPQQRMEVYCVQNVDGGGWTVFQRRIDGVPQRENFIRPWADYEKGFGDLEGEFWLGLKVLHELTSKGNQVLRIDLEDWEGERRWAQYGKFIVASPKSKYKLSIGRYSGDARDSFSGNGYMFTTIDNDNDVAKYNCAKNFKGGWWYKSCHSSNLNGYPYEGKNNHYGRGITWYWWKGNYYSLRKTRMMVRPE